MSDLLIAAGIILIGIIAAYIVAQVFKWLRKRADLTESQLDDILVLSIGKPIIVGILFFPFSLRCGILLSLRDMHGLLMANI